MRPVRHLIILVHNRISIRGRWNSFGGHLAQEGDLRERVSEERI